MSEVVSLTKSESHYMIIIFVCFLLTGFFITIALVELIMFVKLL